MKLKIVLSGGTIEKENGRYVAKNDKNIAISHGKTFVMIKKSLFSYAFKALKTKSIEIKYSKRGSLWEYKIYKK